MLGYPYTRDISSLLTNVGKQEYNCNFHCTAALNTRDISSLLSNVGKQEYNCNFHCTAALNTRDISSLPHHHTLVKEDNPLLSAPENSTVPANDADH